MDEPIYRIQNEKRIKMVSINEGHEIALALIAKVRQMKESGEWDDSHERQKLDDIKSTGPKKVTADS